MKTNKSEITNSFLLINLTDIISVEKIEASITDFILTSYLGHFGCTERKKDHKKKG